MMDTSDSCFVSCYACRKETPFGATFTSDDSLTCSFFNDVKQLSCCAG